MPTIVAAAVVVHDGKVLLTQRTADQHLAGMWEFPGGKLEEGEAPEEALVRECREECGIEVAVHEVVDVTFHRYPEKSVLLLFYRCTWVGGDVQNLQVADHAWVAPGEVRDYALPPADVAVVEKVERLG
ncbi:MAG: 8-oxo-dGTP diphosphatase MutT [Myxococcota bacterium]